MIARKYSLTLLCLLLLLVTGLLPAAQAQEQVIISVAVPEFVKDLVQDNIIDPFEELNPDIKVNLVTAATPFYNPAELETYLDNFEAYVSSADIVIVNETSLSVEATRAGYLLDLAPLVRSDSTMNADDFYPQMWESFQWDGSIWAIPAAGDVVGLLYDPAKFDEFGLFYPDEFWTLTEFEDAIRTMSEVDETTGKVTKSVYLDFTTNGSAGILLSLAGQPIFDPTALDAAPDFSNPELENLLTEWKRLSDDGLFPTPGSGGEIDLNAPLVVGQSLFASFSLPGVNIERKLAPLPGGRSQLNVNALAISAGSLYPEAAYRLIKFATESPATATAFLSALPARRSLAGVEADMQGNNMLLNFLSTPSAESIEQLQKLMESSYPQSQVMFTPYISQALQAVISGEKDARTALQDIGAEAQDGIQIALDRAPDVAISVATPPPDVAVTTGEVELKFGIESLFGNFPNEAEWKAAGEEFAANDPQVGAVTIEPITLLSGSTLQDNAEKYDCFYQSSNIVPTADLTLLLALDPLISSDASFDESDITGGAMSQLRRENQVWGIPLSIRPEAFFYNPTIFNENGAFLPYTGWTPGDFESALRTIKINPTDPAPFAARDLTNGGTYVLLLAAAYGGMPIDYTTNPPTINFTDEASIQAVQQVLDLAKDGYIKYNPLMQTGGVFTGLAADEEVYAMYTELLNAFQGLEIEATDSGNTYEITTFPQGTMYTAVAYDLGAGHISANTLNAEACYRFLTSLMPRNELFNGMPVLRSVLTSPEFATSQGDAAVEFYQGMDDLIQAPGAVVFSTGLNTNVGGESLVTVWLFRAFDKYVAEDNVDLVYEMGEAQLFAQSYLECLSLIPPEQSNSGGLFDKFRVWRDCAIKVDPTTEALLPAF